MTHNDQIYLHFKSLENNERTLTISYLCQMLLPQPERLKIIKDLIGFVTETQELIGIKNSIENKIIDEKLLKLEQKIKDDLGDYE